jgi:glycosyltransferase involved in cell wall biosynthesis
MPLLSVIVPNYNNSAWIRDCLNSILEQTYKNLEIIVADDCSTDDSPYILSKYETNYPNIVRCIYHNKNSGVSYNRHSGILLSKGEYITTIDSDDYYYDSRKIEKEMKLILKYKKKRNKDICSFSNAVLVKEDKTFIAVRGTPETLKEGNLLSKFLMRSCEIPINYICLKSAYFLVGGYDFRLKTHEDWDLKIRLSDKFEFYYTGISGTAYRTHNKGLSSTSHKLRTKNLIRVFRKNIDLIENAPARKTVEDTFNTFMKKRDLYYLRNLSAAYNIKNRKGINIIIHAFHYYSKVFFELGLRGLNLLINKER